MESDYYCVLYFFSLSSCESLQELILTENLLSELPTTLGNLRNLSNLNVDRNRLQEIPSEVSPTECASYCNVLSDIKDCLFILYKRTLLLWRIEGKIYTSLIWLSQGIIVIKAGLISSSLFRDCILIPEQKRLTDQYHHRDLHTLSEGIMGGFYIDRHLGSGIITKPATYWSKIKWSICTIKRLYSSQISEKY